MVLVPKVISFVSVSLSVSRYPLISTALTALFIVAVGYVVAYAPSRLQRSYLCVLAMLAVPCGPEVFGLPSYTFWWSAILLFVVALWDENDDRLALRLTLVTIGGLSSPVITIMLPIYYFRALFFRVRTEAVIAALATLLVGVQVYFVLSTNAATPPPILSLLTNTIPKFFGGLLVGNLFWPSILILALASLPPIGLIAYYAYRNRKDVPFFILIFLILATIALSVARVDPAILHPMMAGPRYYFFPFILMSWTLIYIASATALWRVKLGVVVIFGLTLNNALPAWSHRHGDLAWTTHVVSCSHFSEYTIPVHFSGEEQLAWEMRMDGDTCSDLLDRDPLWNSNQPEPPSFAYSISRDLEAEGSLPTTVEIEQTTMNGGAPEPAPVPGVEVIGSFDELGAATGRVVVSMVRGGRLLYLRGEGAKGQTVRVLGSEELFLSRAPWSREWIGIVFDNDLLPERFLVEIRDQGTEMDEWSAIGIK